MINYSFTLIERLPFKSCCLCVINIKNTDHEVLRIWNIFILKKHISAWSIIWVKLRIIFSNILLYSTATGYKLFVCVFVNFCEPVNLMSWNFYRDDLPSDANGFRLKTSGFNLSYWWDWISPVHRAHEIIKAMMLSFATNYNV